MKRRIIDVLQRGLGTKQILDKLDRLGVATERQSGGLEVLPGTPYSRYAIPLDYQPSRAFAPRWGDTHGLIEPLAKWFAQHHDNYRAFLKEMRAARLDHIPTHLSPSAPSAPAWIGGAITAFDCLALYTMVRKYAPKTYLEIGSGMTTCFARQAVTDAKLNTKVISIDPEPRREVDAICDEVIRDALETCDVALFDRLEPGDILFLDGSHRSFMNSDVTVFFIDVLPRIKPGVVVHVHDILLPWDYPDSFKYWYWNEQYMLAVYMMCSMDRLDPLFPTAWVTRSPEFSALIEPPFVDLGSDEANEPWKHGGSMWFTKRTSDAT